MLHDPELCGWDGLGTCPVCKNEVCGLLPHQTDEKGQRVDDEVREWNGTPEEQLPLAPSRPRLRIEAEIEQWERECYRSDDWWCEVPPVCTALWDEDDWIRHIRASGGFRRRGR